MFIFFVHFKHHANFEMMILDERFMRASTGGIFFGLLFRGLRRPKSIVFVLEGFRYIDYHFIWRIIICYMLSFTNKLQITKHLIL
jgi:hypothetical protein